MKKLSIEEVAPFMAEAFLSMVDVHRRSPPQVQWNLEKGMSLMIRDLERHVQHRVSVAAARKAKEMNLPDLHFLEWRHQRLKMKDPDRKIFHWEHVEQASDIRNAILDLESPDQSKIIALLKKTSLAWILKDEDRRLPKGVRKDPLGLYRDVGIEFVSLPGK